MLDSSQQEVSHPTHTHAESAQDTVVYSSPLTDRLTTQLFDADADTGAATDIIAEPAALARYVQDTARIPPVADHHESDTVYHTLTGTAVLRTDPPEYDSVWDGMVVIEFEDESGYTCESFAERSQFTPTLQTRLHAESTITLDSAWGLVKVTDTTDQRVHGHLFVLTTP